MKIFEVVIYLCSSGSEEWSDARFTRLVIEADEVFVVDGSDYKAIVKRNGVEFPIVFDDEIHYIRKMSGE